jgi:tetratricopeptide (TPR) repeat protein
LSILIGERKRSRERVYSHVPAKIATTATALWLAICQFGFGAAPGMDAYRDGKFNDAYSQFQQTLKSHPQSRAEDELQFDSGAAAYKSEEYVKALESFSQALLSSDNGLQSKSHYNLGNTLYQRGETQKNDDKKLSDWTNALDHYQQTLKIEPQNKEAKDNYDYVKKKIDDLKNKKQQQPPPSPSPSPQQKDKQQKQNQQNQQSQQDQQQNQQQQEQQNQQQQKDQQQQSRDRQSQTGSGKDQKEEKQNEQSQGKNEPQQSKQQKGNQPSPSPSPGEKQQNQQQSGEGEQPSPTPGDHGNEMPSPFPSATNGEGSEENPTPSATPTESPQKKFAGEVKGAGNGESQQPSDKNAQTAEDEAEKEGQMSERQAETLLQSMKDEEARVQLDERKPSRRVYNDW